MRFDLVTLATYQMPRVIGLSYLLATRLTGPGRFAFQMHGNALTFNFQRGEVIRTVPASLLMVTPGMPLRVQVVGGTPHFPPMHYFPARRHRGTGYGSRPQRTRLLRAGGRRKITVQGGYVPNALVELPAGEQVHREAGVPVYSDPTFTFHQHAFTQGGIAKTLKRTLIGGIPFYLHTCIGPGYAAFSRAGAGEIRVVELGPGETIDGAEHSLVLASSTVQYNAIYVPGTGRVRRMVGFWMDRLTGPGTVVVHGHGNILSFALGDGETVDVDHGGILLKDDRIAMEAFHQPLGGGLLGSAMSYYAMRIRGPGRLWLQTMDPSLPAR
jgi:uncharacterized protein (AIM24 family)